MSKRIEKICVIGAGQLGKGIAQVAACAGRLEVSLIDTSKLQLQKAIDTINHSLDKLLRKGQIQEDPATIVNRITATTDYQALKESDFVIESVPELPTLKQSIFEAIDKLSPPKTIIASNTSSISITKLASVTQRPDRVIGMHFMNPVPVMSLVEIIRGMATSQETFAATFTLAESLGKSCCISQDRPGFLVNRLLMPQINEAFYMLMEGVGTAHDIDTGMKLGCNHPMGPLALADFIGLDTCVAVMRVLHQQMGEDKYRPCPLMVQYMDAGWLGRKVGKGVYMYQDE